MNKNTNRTTFLYRLHIDGLLASALALLIGSGLFILYSAAQENTTVVFNQLLHVFVAVGALFVAAQIPPGRYLQWAPWLYGITLVLLIVVLLIGHTGKGATRWLSLGFFRFQPSELMKLALPLMLARYFHYQHLPPAKRILLIASLLLILPVYLVAKEPDLGTALVILSSGVFIIFLAGISSRLIAGLGASIAVALPVLWHFMHDYQRQRVLTFLNPERDPLGSGYHLIQSKIAIGSGGMTGKGFLAGTQTHLQFLPEHTTDFIFSVLGEEFGFIGCILLIAIFLAVLARCIFISIQAHDTFTRLLSGSLSLTFFISMFVNIGMVTGLLPVVGLPLPLVSYGGTSLVTLMIFFGIIMSIRTHRKLLTS